MYKNFIVNVEWIRESFMNFLGSKYFVVYSSPVVVSSSTLPSHIHNIHTAHSITTSPKLPKEEDINSLIPCLISPQCPQGVQLFQRTIWDYGSLYSAQDDLVIDLVDIGPLGASPLRSAIFS
jgi:hypothetical protein